MKRWMRWSPAPVTARTTASRNTCSWATCRSTRKARPRRRPWNTRSTTGRSSAWRRRWGARTSPPRSASAPRTGSTPSIPPPASCARASATAASAPVRVDASGYGTDYTGAMPGGIPGTCRRTWRPGRRTGGDGQLLARLDAVFDAKVDPKVFAHMEDITGLIGWYAHGNRPATNVAYLYAYAGQPWRTQARLKADHGHAILPTIDGLAGNDDLGQMSAWYVHRARLLPGGAGQQPVHPRSPVRAQGDAEPANGKRFQRGRRRPERCECHVGG